MMFKNAFFALTPFEPEKGSKHKSFGSWGPEIGNILAGEIVGAAAGAAIPGAGALAAALAGNPTLAGILGATAIGTGLLGGYIGAGRSLRATEREAGLKPSHFGQLAGRYGGALVGSAALGPIGTVGGDFLTSRYLQKHKLSNAQLDTN